MRIQIIRPVNSSTPGAEIVAQFKAFCATDTVLSSVMLERCPHAIESRVDVIAAAPYVVHAAAEAEQAGFDACIVNCFADPGVSAAREVTAVPVVGPCESSMAIAALLGVNFGVITVVSELVPVIIENARASGFKEKLACVTAVDIPVLELEDRRRLVEAFMREARACIEKGAHVLVAGCTGMVGLAQEVHERLQGEGINIPVVDPQGAAIAIVEGLVRNSLRHSRLTYKVPEHRTRY